MCALDPVQNGLKQQHFFIHQKYPRVIIPLKITIGTGSTACMPVITGAN